MADTAYKYRTRTGTRNVMMTPRDEWVLRQLTRWYALTPAHVYRISDAFNKAEWHPAFGAQIGRDALGEAVFPTDAQGSKAAEVYAMRRRMSVWNAATPRLIRATELDHKLTAYAATTAGAAAIGRPEWVRSNHTNPLLLRHAFAAAEVGLQLETYGYSVLSERELRRGRSIDGVEVPLRFTSDYWDAKSGKATGKEPDLALVAGDLSHYIAVEIERDRHRPVSVYEEKLRAYSENFDVSACWYVCLSETTAKRVKEAQQRVFGHRPNRVRVRVAAPGLPFWHIPYLATDDNRSGKQDPHLAADLSLLQASRGRGLLAA